MPVPKTFRPEWCGECGVAYITFACEGCNTTRSERLLASERRLLKAAYNLTWKSFGTEDNT